MLEPIKMAAAYLRWWRWQPATVHLSDPIRSKPKNERRIDRCCAHHFPQEGLNADKMREK